MMNKRFAEECMAKMVILIGKIRVRLPYVHSLKEKRKTLKTLTARIIRHHGASVREVGAQELLQMMEIGFSLTTLSEMEARDMVYRIEQTIWNTIESEGELIKYETQCILPKVREN